MNPLELKSDECGLEHRLLERGTVYVSKETIAKYGLDLLKKINGGDPAIIAVEDLE